MELVTSSKDVMGLVALVGIMVGMELSPRCVMVIITLSGRVVEMTALLTYVMELVALLGGVIKVVTSLGGGVEIVALPISVVKMIALLKCVVGMMALPGGMLEIVSNPGVMTAVSMALVVIRIGTLLRVLVVDTSNVGVAAKAIDKLILQHTI